MESITISDDYAVINSSSSKGIRQKFYMPETNVWFKQDFGVEEEISNLLSCSSISDYVRYKSIIVNGKSFCSSSGFLATGEEEITFARIIEHMTGKKAGDFVFGYREIKDRFNAVTELIEKYTKVDVVLYVKTLLYLDMLIGNPDRHFNNMAMIHNIRTDSYYPAPIFDNGASLSKDNADMCGNFGGKHEYVLSSIGSINSPIRFDYDSIGECNETLKERLIKYESVFRYTGKFDIKEFGSMLTLIPPYLVKDGEVDYVKLVERSFIKPEPEQSKEEPLDLKVDIVHEYHGRKITLRRVSSETGFDVNTLKYHIRRYGFETTLDTVYNGYTPSDINKSYSLLDGTKMTRQEVCEKYNVELKWLLEFEKKKGREYIEKHLTDGDLLTFDDSKPVYLNIPGYKFTKNELAYLLNIKLDLVDSYMSNLQKLLKMYHFEERLEFKEKAYNATWMSEDTWKYVCPTCGRKLILSTDEIKKHYHKDSFCEQHEI